MSDWHVAAGALRVFFMLTLRNFKLLIINYLTKVSIELC